MRILVFWSGLATAALLAQLEPAWGYATLAVLALLQLALLSGAERSVFLAVHYATVLIYFSIAPALQIATDAAFWSAGVLGEEAHRQALWLLLLYLAGVEAVRLVVLPSQRAHGAALTPGAPRAAPLAHPLAIFALQIGAFGIQLLRPDLNFVPRGEPFLLQVTPLELIVFTTVPRLLLLLAFVALAIHAARQRTVGALLLAAASLALVVVGAHPVHTARQVLLIGLMPLLIHLLGATRPRLLALLCFTAVAGLGPLLNFVSRGAMWGESLTVFPYSQDFDTMYVVAGLLERVPAPEAGWGRYLLSASSFVLPRDWKLYPAFDPLGWPQVQGQFSQTNLSLAPFTTAWLDFGWAGPLLLGALISAVFCRVDRAIEPRGPLTVRYLLALVLLAAYVPFLRGPILGWGPFFASGVIAAVVVGTLAQRARHAAALRATAAA